MSRKLFRSQLQTERLKWTKQHIQLQRGAAAADGDERKESDPSGADAEADMSAQMLMLRLQPRTQATRRQLKFARLRQLNARLKSRSKKMT